MSLPKGIERLAEAVWELPASFKPRMLVPARIFASEKLLHKMEDGVFDQMANAAALPGVVKYACCMPDGHWGYGLPIGGVAPVDATTGVISPGAIGFDINCGMRLIRTDLTHDEVKPHLRELVQRLFKCVPAGVGCTGTVKVSMDEFRRALEQGARWCVERGYGWEQDLERTEEEGCMAAADASKVSARAVERGYRQLGTLGSGNHYLEIQVARPENIFDSRAAEKLGVTIPNQVLIMFHCGSRGFGHQVATDYLQSFEKASRRKGGSPGGVRELTCAPFQSSEGQAYFAAMACAVNMAFANRQLILHRIREVFADVFKRSPEELGLRQVYDISHNTAKLERHVVDGKTRRLLVHRKGATRALGPGMPGIPKAYRDIGQPVIIGGSMETGSYLLVGSADGQQAFYTTAHGSGRTMSRKAARKSFRGDRLQADMERRGIYVKAVSHGALAEEAGGAYKNIDEVVEATELAGISKRVVRLVPVGNIKG